MNIPDNIYPRVYIKVLAFKAYFKSLNRVTAL